LERAKNAIALYRKKDLSPYWAKVDFKEKGEWFRVFAGHFNDREEAERFGQEHGLSEPTIKKTQYANLIGTYSDEEELKGKIMKLEDLGYSPYTIRQPNGTSRLFVGAYLTEAGAGRQSRDLKPSGVQGQVVKR